MKKAIVTGFEPFGPYVDIGNPVQDLARECDGKKLGDIEVIGLIVPCTYHGAFKLLSENNFFKFLIIFNSYFCICRHSLLDKFKYIRSAIFFKCF